MLVFIFSLISIIKAADPFIWPLPQKFTISDTASLPVSINFTITTSSTSQILKDAIERYHRIMFDRVPMTTAPSNSLASLTITTKSDDETLQYGVDESYSLVLNDVNNKNNAIQSNTVYGALRALETLSQVIIYNLTSDYYMAYEVTSIEDKPRFDWRGILIDTSRHYQSVESIRRVLDAMSYAKYNVLHWHIVDAQSFPYESVKYPTLSEGAWSQYLRYTLNDISDIVKHAKDRGIRVVPEFDMPGHSSSWCVGLPEICESPYGKNQKNCGVLNPSVNVTFDVINNLFIELGTVFEDDYLHIGGDEVSPNCYQNTPSIVDWMNANGLNGTSAILDFDLKAIELVKKNGKKPVNWVEVFDSFKNYPNFNNSLTVIEVWKAKSDLQAAVGLGYTCILADSDLWYLDHLQITWDKMYMNEPYQNIANTTQQALIMGGEACMWGETVDVSDIQQTIWPRAAAVAERLWSDESVNDVSAAKSRIEYFRCLLNERGIAAAPVNNAQARSAPPGPGNCYLQR